MKPEEFDLLLERHLDGTLTGNEQKELATALEDHEWARDRFVGRMTLAADLRDRLATASPQVSMIKRDQRMRWFLSLATAALVAIGLFFFLQPPTGGSGIRVVAAEGVGTLNIEALVKGNETQLREGILELELNRESRIVIEAPATFRLISPKHVFLSSGRCFAEMQKGKSGLLIETPFGEALDLGTQFAVEVSSPKEMKVHVFDGSVEVSGKGDTRKRLIEGQALALKDTGAATDVSANFSFFVPRVPQALAKDTPYLHWPFDEGEGQIVRPTGQDMDSSSAAGKFVSGAPGKTGPSWIPGVKGNALNFERNAWISTKHEGIGGNEDRTVACWVKLPLEEKSAAKGAPLIAWGYFKQRNKGGISTLGKSWLLSVASYKEKTPQWYGVPQLRVRGQTIHGQTNLRDGKWHHIAAVAMNGSYGTSILLYVDGRLEKAHRDIVMGRIDTATDPKVSSPVQFGRHLWAREIFLRGSLDEVYIFGAALSGDEIRQLMGSVPDGTNGKFR